jgi:hypothetical protein
MVNDTEQQMKDYAYYSTINAPFPNKEQFVELFVMKGDKLIVDGVSVDEVPLSKLARYRKDGCMIEQRMNNKKWNDALQAYSSEKNEKMRQFKRDLFEQNRVYSCEKVELLFEKCCNLKANTSLKAIADMFSYFVDLVK